MGDEELNDDKIARNAITDPTVPKIYTNGFVAGVSHSDVFLVLQSSVNAVGVIQMSYTVAKSMALTLTQLVSDFEKATEQEVLTVGQIKEKIEKLQRAERGKEEK